MWGDMLRLYNTMTRSVDEFRPIQDRKVGLYTCGPTVYNYAHIGNLRTYVFEDILKRTLKVCGYDVRHVMNITDVGHLTSDADTGDDKMEAGATREGKSALDIAKLYEDAFKEDLKQLNIIPPDVWCKATENIPEQIELVRTLELKGYTYVIEGDGVYFDTSRLPDYGKLVRLDVEGLRAGARVEMVAGKKNPTDFALWKFSPKDIGKKRQMEWDSPWGVGFPGWHLECSVMAVKYLGERLDIHCGGVDHQAVHHTNEIAQTEAAYGHPWVNWWMHGEWLVLPKEGGEAAKMSKSAGEFLTLDFLTQKGYDPLAFRYFCLNAHYRQQVTFTWEALDAAQNAFSRLKVRTVDLRDEKTKSKGKILEDYYRPFVAAVEDDLNMPQALAAMWKFLDARSVKKEDVYATLKAMDQVLGFEVDSLQVNKRDYSCARLAEPAVSQTVKYVDQCAANLAVLQHQARSAIEDDQRYNELEAKIDEQVLELLKIRYGARQKKEFELADYVRGKLASLGYEIRDNPDGGVTFFSAGV
jgi:cysteinyl-tRNA synthetase